MSDAEVQHEPIAEVKSDPHVPTEAGNGTQHTGTSQAHLQTYNIFVGDLPHNITESQMRDHFSKYGDIKMVNIIRDKVTGLCKGTC